MPKRAATPSPSPLVPPPASRPDQGRQHGQPPPPQLKGQARYHSIFAVISPYFRRRRMKAFATTMQLHGSERILDIGGGPGVWRLLNQPGLHVTLLNTETPVLTPEDAARWPHLTAVHGDATRLQFSAGSFDIIFSNSVIEHLHTWENQQTFAREALRVAGHSGRLWIQTPARQFFIEPHFLTIGLHWLPKSWQLHLLPWLSLWGWTRQPSKSMTQAWLDEIRLLSESEMKQLFPHCLIRKERFLGLWTKSYIATTLGRS